METEIWLPVVWYEGLYEVSNLWRVRSIDRIIERSWYFFKKKWIIKKQCVTWNYLNTCFCKKWIKVTRNVHNIVAQTFIPNHDNLPLVCHLVESIPANNSVSNLFWGTYKDNTQDMIKKWRSRLRRDYWKWKKSIEHPSSIKILQYTLDWILIKEWDSTAEAKLILWITWILNCLKWRNKTAWCFIWKYS